MDTTRRSVASAAARVLLAIALVLLGIVTAASEARAQAAPCPSALRFIGNDASSTVDFGWTGFAHDLSLVGGALTMRTSCLPSGTPCTNCSVSGPVANVTGYNQRCVGDTAKICGTDADCGADAPCGFYLAPPQPVGVGGVSVCLVDKIGGTLSGTVNIPAGDFTSLKMPFSWEVFLGGPQDHPCPRCIGDPTPNDAVRGGTCDSGPHQSAACDGNATSPMTDFGVTSYDCPPVAAQSIGQLAVPTVPLSSRTGGQAATLTAASPACTAFGSGTKCFCDTCATAAAEPCFTSADCPGGSICGGRRCLGGATDGTPCTIPGTGDPVCMGSFCAVPGQPTRPNFCVDDTSTPAVEGCTDTAPVGDNKGECSAGPVDFYCAAPEQYRGCLGPADCPITGSCQPQFRKCYLDNGVMGGSVGVSGIPDPPVGGTAHPTLGALYCLPPMTASAANSAGGFPGLGRLLLPGTLTLAQEIASRPIPGGSSLSTGTDPSGGTDPNPTGSDPIETTVTTPNAGPVSIVEQNTVGSPPSGYTFVNQQVNITAPAASAGNPLILKFFIDASRLTGVTGATCGVKKNNILVQKDGGPPTGIPPCANPAGTPNVSPTPTCVAKRECLAQPAGDNAASSDVKITVWTTTASIWQFAIPEPAAPFTIPGKKLQLKDAADPTKRKLTLQLASASLVTPAPGSPDDPRCVANGGGGDGATLDVFGTGGSTQYVGLTLPCENWTAIGDPADGKGYAYKDSHQLAGPCTSVSVQNGKQLKAVCNGKSLTRPLDYDLTNGEGSVGVTFRMGSGLSYCTEFAGTSLKGKPVVKKDTATTFQAQDATAPGACPVQ